MYTTQIDETWQPRIIPSAVAWTEAAAVLATQAGVERIGFRLNAPARLPVRLEGEARTVEISDRTPSVAWASLDDGAVVLDMDGLALTAALAEPPTVEAAVRSAGHAGDASQPIEAPMPGTVIAVRVGAGDEVAAGHVLILLEAMKMENTVTAPAAGRVERVLVSAGDQVRRGQVLVELS
jgi:biotin carboxyl carrier protein